MPLRLPDLPQLAPRRLYLDLARQGRWSSWFPTTQAIAKLRVFDFHEDPAEKGLYWSFLPDLQLRWLHYRAIRRLMEIDKSVNAQITADEDTSRHLDPETLEHLRGLGYIN